MSIITQIMQEVSKMMQDDSVKLLLVFLYHTFSCFSEPSFMDSIF